MNDSKKENKAKILWSFETCDGRGCSKYEIIYGYFVV